MKVSGTKVINTTLNLMAILCIIGLLFSFGWAIWTDYDHSEHKECPACHGKGWIEVSE